jgi:hypothetical protein
VLYCYSVELANSYNVENGYDTSEDGV